MDFLFDLLADHTTDTVHDRTPDLVAHRYDGIGDLRSDVTTVVTAVVRVISREG